MPQHPFIANDTLLNNIAYPGRVRDIKRIKELMASLGLADLFNGNVASLEDVIGENGIQLSGGQAQRVALTRALVQDKDVLIIDEGTSALDDFSAVNVVDTLKMIKEEKLIIVVSHRKEILEICDRVFSLDCGVFSEITA